MDNEKILSRLVQVGVVTDIDAERSMVRVKFRDTGITSDWLRVLQRYRTKLSIEPDAEHTHSGSYAGHWMPGVNDMVLVIYLPVENSDGYVLGGVSV